MEIRKHFVQNFIARVCFALSSFLVVLFFSRVLKAAGSGELYYAINNYAAVALVASLSLESGFIYFLSRNEMDEKEIASLAMCWPLLAGGLCSFLLVLAPRHFITTHLYYTFYYSLTFLTGTLLVSFFSALFMARRQFLLPLMVQAITNVVVIAYCSWKRADIVFITRLYFFSFLLNGLLLAAIYYFKYPRAVFFKWPAAHTVRLLLRYSLIALIANIVAFLAFRIDYWILESFTPQKITYNDLGNYIQVAKIVQLFLFLPTIIATVVFPSAASAGDQRFHPSFKRSVGWVLLFNTVVCVVIVLVGNWLFPFLFGNSFTAMYQCFVFSIPAILAITVVRVLAAFFAGTNRVKYNLVGGLIALGVISFLNFLLVPRMGINGAALADSIGYLAYMIFLLVFSIRFNNRPL